MTQNTNFEEEFEGLARMIQNGFKEVHDDLKILKIEQGEIKESINKFGRKNELLENRVLLSNEQRFDNVEDQIRLIKTKLQM